MSVKAKYIINLMEQLAPLGLAEHWDNPGLMVGNKESDVNKVLFALDCSETVIDEAININANMIITHHPMIFKGIKSIDYNTPLGKKIVKAIINNIVIYSAHTNLDIAEGGTNTALSELIGLSNTTPLLKLENNKFIGKCGDIQPISFRDFISFFKNKIKADYLNINGNQDRIIKRVGLCTGSAASSDYIFAAKENSCDLYITGDVGYHDAQIAEENNICIIDGTHYLTEIIVMPRICEYIKSNINDIECVCTSINTQTLKTV